MTRQGHRRGDRRVAARLQTDRIDLYQTHWPIRGVLCVSPELDLRSAQATLEGRDRGPHERGARRDAGACGRRGKIRAWGLSNESAWGTAEWLRLAEARGLPRVASIQNEYSLICRLLDTDLAELAVNEKVTLLAYSPLAAGLLTGKYQGDAVPEGSRREASPDLFGRCTERAFAAVDAYLGIADRHGLDPVHMALAFTVQRPFPVSTIFGATTSGTAGAYPPRARLDLSQEVLNDLDAMNRAMPMPY
jgi:aryl-alcohol dehydrogenase-like predicted oxidoreductase